MFAALSVENAPEASRPAMRSVAEAWGGAVPDAVARLAASPELLNGFLAMSASFENCTLDPLAREVVIMTVAVRNDCHVCVAIHTGRLRKLGADQDLVTALREGRAPSDERLAAVRTFTLDVLATTGGVADDAVEALLAHGYTERNALEVVLGIGAYTMSTFANRLVRAA
ncbi:carboxymuconolactone decarboxylase family protein [Streptomyces sp. RFCAC02]|uniref:carboxymuconolactone decarboxylase family protein n=1 Tax=Streptomyces sp. RFCAC02 TaxID=2499143 RepID=UPI00102210FF|nr:carboxymuconolactone decarboxylase family protein [Streptomyces sp. RFCAC02]